MDVSTFHAPDGWRIIGPCGNGWALREIAGGLRVIVDWEMKVDGYQWLHVSFSRKSWVPTHDDALKVKHAFIGDRYAYQVFPHPDNYVNIHKFCLHLWSRLDGGMGMVLPEFSEILEGIGRSI
jgi:hypothetical protein